MTRSRSARRLLAVVPAVALALLMLPGGTALLGAGAVGSPSSATTGSPGRVVVAPGFAAPHGARTLGPLAARTPMTVLVGLALSDPSGLDARTVLEETPGNPLYRQYLSPSEIAGDYAAAPAVTAAAIRYFDGEGLNVSRSPDGLLLTVSGPARAMGAAFDTEFVRYSIGGSLVFAHAGPASLPAGIPWSGALGLGNTTPIRPAAVATGALGSLAPSASCITNDTFGYFPCEIDQAYNLTPALARGWNGTGYRIAVVDAYDSAETQRELSRDLNSFDALTGLSRGNVSFVYPDPTTTDLNSTPSSGWADEDALDLEWARASAPGASEEMVLSPNASIGLYEAVDWVVAHRAADVISLSWGEPDVGVYDAYAAPCSSQCNATTDGSYELLHPVLEAAAAEGIGVFAASDDCGAAGGTSGVSTDFPSSDPYVTGVGGTVLNVAGDGSYLDETGWSGNSTGAVSPGCYNQGGSGGGYSPYPRPSWQSAPGVPSNISGRGVPDVSIVGGSPVFLVIGNSTTAAYGTSEGTPMWAGLELLADDAAGERLGSLDPSLYALARGPDPARYFHDITSGDNGYAAGPGWDPVTGLGTPTGTPLLSALSAGPVVSDGLRVDLFGSPRLGRAPLTTTFRVVPSNNTTTYPFVDVAFGDGNATLLNGTWTISHTYAVPGVYDATVTAVDARGNSSTAPPIAVVVGGGGELNVTLNASSAAPALGDPVTFTASVHDDTGPYSFSYYFGDGTYAMDTPNATIAHTFFAAGSYCATVVVSDGARPANGGASLEVPIAAGGAPPPNCPSPKPLVISFSSNETSADLPGDLPLAVRATGGIPPVSVAYVASDPYVAACDCGIFREPGNETVRAYVNDSLAEQAVASLNVTLHPSLALTASASALTGPAPLDVDFHAALSGGYHNSSPTFDWSFGDGATLAGADPSPGHAYTTPGIYTAYVVGIDSAGGRVGAVWVINVTSGSPGLAVGVTVTPAVDTPSGTLMDFRAAASGGVAPYRYLWALGDNDSAFGPNVSQSYTAPGCLSEGSCPLSVHLTVWDASGATWSTTFEVPTPSRLRSSAVTFEDGGPVANGVTPYRLALSASVAGVPGLSVNWSFGDGTYVNGTSVYHTYYAPGNYTIVETVTDPYGDRLVRTHALTVSGPSYPPLSGNASATPTIGVAPLFVRFNASAAGGVGGNYTVRWTFGDGEEDEGPVGTPVLHTYAAAGTFNATATILDAAGDQVLVPLTVEVYAPTVVLLSANLTPATVTTAGTTVLSVDDRAFCTAESVPGCGNGSVPLDLLVSAPGGAVADAARIGGPLLPTAFGTLNATVGPFPNLSGPVWIWASAAGPNYTGSVHVALLIEGLPVPCAVCGSSGLFGLAPDEALSVMIAAFVGVPAAVLGVLALWIRRRPPPAEVGPPTGPPSAASSQVVRPSDRKN